MRPLTDEERAAGATGNNEVKGIFPKKKCTTKSPVVDLTAIASDHIDYMRYSPVIWSCVYRVYPLVGVELQRWMSMCSQ